MLSLFSLLWIIHSVRADLSDAEAKEHIEVLRTALLTDDAPEDIERMDAREILKIEAPIGENCHRLAARNHRKLAFHLHTDRIRGKLEAVKEAARATGATEEEVNAAGDKERQTLITLGQYVNQAAEYFRQNPTGDGVIGFAFGLTNNNLGVRPIRRNQRNRNARPAAWGHAGAHAGWANGAHAGWDDWQGQQYRRDSYAAREIHAFFSFIIFHMYIPIVVISIARFAICRAFSCHQKLAQLRTKPQQAHVYTNRVSV